MLTMCIAEDKGTSHHLFLDHDYVATIRGTHYKTSFL